MPDPADSPPPSGPPSGPQPGPPSGPSRPERPDPGRDGLSREELARELIRERLLPVSRDDRPTAERFFPGRRPARTDLTAESHPGAGAWYEQGEMVAASEPRSDESFPDAEPSPGSAPSPTAAPTTGRTRRSGTPPAQGRPSSARKAGGPAKETRKSAGSGQSDAASAAVERSSDGPAEPDPASTSGGTGAGSEKSAEAVSGPDLARAVLDAALAKRREYASRNPRRRGAGEGTGKRLRGYSGPGPDPRDPQLFGDMLQRLMRSRGWERPHAEATVFGAWEKVVGADIAQHSRPVKLDAGVLTVEAESTAWATQLRLLTGRILKSIAAEVGHNVVSRLNIHGPAAPSWTKGPRRVQGRGPRDTYG